MQALTVTSSIATFPVAPTASVAPARAESGLLRGILFGVAIQATALGAIAGAWMMVHRF